MIYTQEVENMCPVAKGANMNQLQSRKRENGFIPKKLKIFQVLHMA